MSGRLSSRRHCGLAFQLTNILRDLAEDAVRGRVYLPEEELRRFEYSMEDLRRLCATSGSSTACCDFRSSELSSYT